MATLRRITRANPLSATRQVARAGGTMWADLALAMDVAYERFAPAAAEAFEQQGEEAGRELARQQMGDGLVSRRTVQRTVSQQPVAGPTDFDFTPYAVGGATRPDSFTNLDPAFRSNVASMLQAADAEGVNLRITSAYRSNELQAQLWQGALKKYGDPEIADNWVARPGSSMHNKGLAVDFAGASGGLLRDANSREAKWLKANAGRFGLDVPLGNEPWQIEQGGARGQPVPQVTRSAPVAAETIIRKPNGKLETKDYHPLSGPILQAHNAAKQVAYLSEVESRAIADFTNLQHAHPFDPDGFDKAARDYISEMVSSAPEQFRSDLRTSLETQARRSHLGLVDAQHRDIRARANNESRALTDRYSTELSEAIASGNADEISAARENLVGVLAARETLPGAAWTSAQSDNVVLKAERDAEKIIATQTREQTSALRGELKLAIDAANAGRTSANEAIAASEDAMALLPELAREAQAAIAFRDAMPEFYGLPPEQRADVVENIKSQPVQEDWQIGLGKQAEKANAAATKAWENSPIETAQEYLQTPPPAIVTDLENPDAVVASLEARREYVNSNLVEGGLIEEPVYFSEAETQMVGSLLAADLDPELRAAGVEAVVRGFGPDAAIAMEQLGQNDPVLRMAGQLMSRGGDTATAVEALRGQQLLRENLVQLPSKGTRIANTTADMSLAFRGIPEAEKKQAEISTFAQALYAARGQGIDPKSDEAADLWEQSVQRALGQRSKNGVVKGGIQDIFNNPVLLPPSVAASEVSKAISRAMGPGVRGALAETAAAISGALSGEDRATGDLAIWEAVGGVPHVLGAPVQAQYFRAGQMRLAPVPGGNGMQYRMEFTSGDTVIPATDSESRLYVFDIGELVQAGLMAAIDPIVAPERLSPEQRKDLEDRDAVRNRATDLLAPTSDRQQLPKQSSILETHPNRPRR